MKEPQIDFDDYIRTLFKESDRGCILLIASYLDEQLKDTHRHYIDYISSPPQKLSDDLFKSNGPLSTFSSRIKIGFTYGLLNKESFQDLDMIRGLRNDVAHNIKSFSLNDASIRTKIFKINAAKRLTQNPDIQLEEVEIERIKNPTDDNDTAKLYLLLCGMQLTWEIQKITINSLKMKVAQLQKTKGIM